MCFKFWKIQKQPTEVFLRKGILRSFAKITGKHLCQSLFFNKKETLTRAFLCGFCKVSKNTFLQNTYGRLLLKITK